MSSQQQRHDDDDAVRSAFRENDPFRKRWPISDEDLAAYMDADYDKSDDSESSESTERRETNPLLAAGDHTILIPPSSYGSIQQELRGRSYLILEPRRERRGSPLSNLVRPKGVRFFALALVLLGIFYLSSPVLGGMFSPKEQGASPPV